MRSRRYGVYIRAREGTIHAPVGTIWHLANDLPELWLCCDGRTLNKEKYAELYGVLGDEYAPRVEKKYSLWQSVKMFFKTGKWKRVEWVPMQTGNVFYLPDLRERWEIDKEKSK